MLTNRHVIKMC